MKVSELSGRALDWVVATMQHPDDADLHDPESGVMGDHEAYSTDRHQGGLILERERVATYYRNDIGWCATMRSPGNQLYEWIGPTPLVAGLRCLIAHKLGDTIDIPKELL